jgi:hypothetical protein
VFSHRTAARFRRPTHLDSDTGAIPSRAAAALRQACVYRAITSQSAPSAAGWSRLVDATLIALVLLGVIVLVVAGGVL